MRLVLPRTNSGSGCWSASGWEDGGRGGLVGLAEGGGGGRGGIGVRFGGSRGGGGWGVLVVRMGVVGGLGSRCGRALYRGIGC